VYRCGFARNQAAYDAAEADFWSTLEAVEETLQAQAAGIPTPQPLGNGNSALPDPAGTSAGAGSAERRQPSGDPLGPAAPGGPWLAGGPTPSLADVQLFPTLVRLELVYGPLFGVSRRPLWQLPAIWDWRRRFFALPGVAATCFPEAWRRDYFGALFPLHPSGIIPAGPDLASLLSAMPPASPLTPSRLAEAPQP
jgi:putative glutathione S-transferase